jgi:hypothetical protein
VTEKEQENPELMDGALKPTGQFPAEIDQLPLTTFVTDQGWGKLTLNCTEPLVTCITTGQVALPPMTAVPHWPPDKEMDCADATWAWQYSSTANPARAKYLSFASTMIPPELWDMSGSGLYRQRI